MTKRHLFKIKYIIIMISLLILVTACEKKDKTNESYMPKEEFKQAIPLDATTFQDIAVQYKDAMDQGQRGNLIGLAEKNSRNIIYHTINWEHMIYFAAVNGIGTNKLILILRTENTNLQFQKHEIDWINNRWKFESEALLNGKFTRPKIPPIKELLNVKITTKKYDNYEYNIYFGDAKIDITKYNINPNYIPFYWEYDETTKTIYVPEICLNVIQTTGMAKVNLAKSLIMRGKKPIKVLDHPLFLWRGSVPNWAEQTIRNERYFYEAQNTRKTNKAINRN